MIEFTAKELRYLLDAIEGNYDWRTPEAQLDKKILKEKLEYSLSAKI